MLDINLFRVDKGGDPDVIRESQRRRYASVDLVDEVIALDASWRALRGNIDTLNMEFNAANKAVAAKKKAKEDATEEMAVVAGIKAKVKDAEVAVKEAEEARDAKLHLIGNIVHDSVPVSDDEKNNRVERTWGLDTKRDGKAEGCYNHYDLVQLLDIVNLESGTEVAGSRGYYLMREGALLNQAIITYGTGFLMKRKYSPVQTPFFMRKPIMAECAQLAQFDEELYKVTGDGDDKYLIATSEQTLCTLHRKSWFEAKQLPVRYAGYSTCFRKEAGSHGRDTLGIFRVHQFEKVEQFVICSPYDDESWKMQGEMIDNSEAFYQSLGLPYQVVNIVSGELNDAAAKKWDLEAWFPGSNKGAGEFRELVSCSNCTDFQSRRLEIRLRTNKNPGLAATGMSDKAHVHLLNSTLCATERALCCILENHQTKDGVVVPDVLVPYMHGIRFIPFRFQFDKKGKLVERKLAVPKALPEADKGADGGKGAKKGGGGDAKKGDAKKGGGGGGGGGGEAKKGDAKKGGGEAKKGDAKKGDAKKGGGAAAAPAAPTSVYNGSYPSSSSDSSSSAWAPQLLDRPMVYVTSKASVLGRLSRTLLAGNSKAPPSRCMLSVVEEGSSDVAPSACGVSLVEPATIDGTHGLCPEGAESRPSVSVNPAHICRRLAVHNGTWPSEGSAAAAALDAFVEVVFPALVSPAALGAALEQAASAPAYTATAAGRTLSAPELYACLCATEAKGLTLGAAATKLVNTAKAQIAQYDA